MGGLCGGYGACVVGYIDDKLLCIDGGGTDIGGRGGGNWYDGPVE